LQRTAAAVARGLQLRDLASLLFLERREPLFLHGQRGIERIELGQVAVDGGDLAGAGAAKVLVVGEHAARLGGVALVEQ
jgi:hypothetical protein